jgi:hypothetical protein
VSPQSGVAVDGLHELSQLHCHSRAPLSPPILMIHETLQQTSR